MEHLDLREEEEREEEEEEEEKGIMYTERYDLSSSQLSREKELINVDSNHLPYIAPPPPPPFYVTDQTGRITERLREECGSCWGRNGVGRERKAGHYTQ